MTRPRPGGPPSGDRPKPNRGGSSDAPGEPPSAGNLVASGEPADATSKDAQPRHSHPAAHGGTMFALALGALGVVFGDIGTSPLYAMQTVFSLDNHKIKATHSDVYGVISLVFWSITIVVSIKYVAFILRADNDGEGGVMALGALARQYTRDRKKLVTFALFLAVVGASLFYGDSVITPAISVLSSVEGLEVVSPGLHDAVVPIGIAILTALFLVQRFGTHLVGRFFGPIMALWFLVLAVTGLPKVIDHPDILRALSPTYIFAFVADHPFLAFIALGAVVLSITGAEALYADMGHFGRAPIRRAWFFLVFPCLTLNYLGQGALVLHEPGATENPFFLLGPHWARIPLVILATFATVIASQAVISGAYSVSRQAVRLGYLPNLTVRHTSKREGGQIYVPAVNWLVFGSVLALILAFRSSQKLATLYGFAVTGTFLIDTTLFLIVAASMWHWSRPRLITVGVLFGVVEISFFGANVTKIASGGWLPLCIALAISTVMLTWQAGRQIVTRRRAEMEGPLQDFVDDMRERELVRVPGTAVFPHPTKETTPLALRANVDANHVLHEHVVLVSVRVENVPYIHEDERVEIDHLVHTDDGIVHVELRFGFQDEQDIPESLHLAIGSAEQELNFDPDDATYFISRLTLTRGDADGMATWRKRIFIGLAHNAANPANNFCLPLDRTVVMGSHLDV